jgi:hypothetical protein
VHGFTRMIVIFGFFVRDVEDTNAMVLTGTVCLIIVDNERIQLALFAYTICLSLLHYFVTRGIRSFPMQRSFVIRGFE